MNISNGNRDFVDWIRVLSAIGAMIGLLVAATMYISTRTSAVFQDQNDPRFPWNRDRGLIEKRITDNEKDLERLMSASESQRLSIQGLQTSTQNLLQAQRELTNAQSELARNLDKHIISTHKLYFDGKEPE